MIRAAIDIGSNSVLLLIQEIEGENVVELASESFVTALGKDLDKTGRLSAQSIEDTFEALSFYGQQMDKFGVHADNILVTATEACRVAKNADEFIMKVKEKFNLNIVKITGDGEAYYTGLGVSLTAKNVSSAVIMDIGGASTELMKVKFAPFAVESSTSLPVGSVRGTDWKKEELFSVKMKELLSDNLKEYSVDTLICVAGTMTSLAAIYLNLKKYDDKKIEGLTIDLSDFEIFCRGLGKISHAELLQRFPYLEKRIPILYVGAEIALLFCYHLNVKQIMISTKGLRYGVNFKGEIDGRYKFN